MNQFDVAAFRAQFPSLTRRVNGNPAIYFDSPGGTQVPSRVIDKVVDYYINHNANSGGVFAASVETDEIIANTRLAFADFFNCMPEEVSFGENSTSISFRLSQAIARDLNPGDEILITDMDHDANRSPWQILTERGIKVQAIAVSPDTLTLDLDDLKAKLSKRTKVVAFNYASNAVGTISNAAEIIKIAKSVGAITVVDAVHFALHGLIDVQKLDVDYLFCSVYKFFGPHVGVLYGKKEQMHTLRTLKVSAQKDYAPDKFETGTLNHEGLAGAAEAVNFIASIGEKYREERLLSGDISLRRQNLSAAMHVLEEYEAPLTAYFKQELRQIKGLTLYCPKDGCLCTSTISFRIYKQAPRETAAELAAKGIFVWTGGFYAVGLIKTLGLENSGGMVRIGLAPYNTREEIDRTLEVLQEIAARVHSQA